MSYSAVYGLNPATDVREEIEEYRNSHGTSTVIWDLLEKKFFPDLKYSIMIDDGAFERMWKLVYDEAIALPIRAVLTMTADYAYISKENYVRMAKDLKTFFETMPPYNPEYVNHWPKIIKLLESNPEYPAIGFYWTSCGDNFWGENWRKDSEGNEYKKAFDWSKAFEVYQELLQDELVLNET